MKKSFVFILLSLIATSALAQNTFYEAMLDANYEREARAVAKAKREAAPSVDYINVNLEYVITNASTKTYSVTGIVAQKVGSKTDKICDINHSLTLGGKSVAFECGDFIASIYLTEIKGKVMLVRALYDDNSTVVDNNADYVAQKTSRNILEGVTFKRPGEM
ncbi:MAG: hypothetical protein IT286_02950 [Proteobacteria bacterium]|jgi:hypothetical protein|nr:hypothetical protein [Pseudomonadota bacterium]